jgi:HPt (histidine-containing phosphotransfer) domain-containing protein
VTTHRNAPEAARNAFAACSPVKAISSGILDLEELRSRCMGNIELVQQVLKKFESRTPEEIEAIEKALQLQDTQQIARVAHRLRGTSATVSAEGLTRAAAEIEDVSRQGRLADLPTGVERLRDEWEKYLNCAAALLSAATTESTPCGS